MFVYVIARDINKALQTLKKKIEKEGFTQVIKHRRLAKPSEPRKLKRIQVAARQRRRLKRYGF